MKPDFGQLTEFSYFAGSYFGRHEEIKIERIDDDFYSLTFINARSRLDRPSQNETKINKDDVISFVTGIHKKYLSKWKDRYEDRNVLDGFGYKVNMKLGEDTYSWSGYAKNPGNFKEFVNELVGFAKENLAKQGDIVDRKQA